MAETGSARAGRGRRYALVATVVILAVAAIVAVLLLRPRPPQAQLQLEARARQPESPAVSARYAAWTDTSHGRTGVMLFDSADGSRREITPPQIDCSQPAIAGDTVVYVDTRSGEADLYRYDATRRTNSPFVVAPGRQSAPSADGDWVVWEDDRTGFGPRVHARRLSGGAEVVVPAAKPGGVQRRPQVGGGFVVFEEYDGGLSAGDASVYGYDLASRRLEAIATSPTVHLLPSTDGTQVAWCEQQGLALNVVLLDRRTGTRSSPPSACLERTTPAVSGGTLYWVERCAKGRFGIYSWRPGEASVTTLPGSGSGDRLGIRASQGSLAWLELRRHWFVRASLAGPASTGAQASIAPSAEVRDASVGGLALAQNTVAPEPPVHPRASASGTDSVLVTWEQPPSSADIAGYYVYRHNEPITPSNIGSAQRVAAVTAPPAIVPLAPNEAATQYTLYYAVLVRDTAGHTALSVNTVPDPHGTAAGNTETCQRCHQNPSAVTPIPGARRSCYTCHGNTPDTALYGAGSSTDAQAGFHDDTGTPPPASRHRNGFMTDNARECDACHTPHRKPYNTDPASSYTMLLRTQLATATSGQSGFRYNTSATPVGNAFCFDCHGTNLTPIALVGGPTAYLNAGGDHETGWAASVHGMKVPAPNADPGIQCLTCHDPHASSASSLLGVFDPASETNRIAGSVVTGDDSSVCLACHALASAGFPIYSRDASGFPVSGTWPGAAAWRTAYDRSAQTGSMHTASTVVWPVTTYAGGACQNCHRMHGPSDRYAILRDTDATGNPGVYPFSSDDFRFCFNCHDGTPGFDVSRYYPPAAGGAGPAGGRAGHATVTSGTLPAGSALPCYDCHNPHGSASAYGLQVVTQLSATQTVSVGDAAGELTMGPGRGATQVREFCLTCHTTADTASGWDGSGFVGVASGAKVEGIDRVSPASVLRLPPEPSGHAGTDTQSCYACHGNDYSGSGGNAHAPGVAASAAGTTTVPTMTVPPTTGP